MTPLALTVATGPLDVRRFAIHEAVSEPWVVDVVALSPDPSLDLSAITGRAATFRIESALGGARVPERRWEGVCRRAVLVQAEPTGLSTYRFEIVAALWLQGRNRRHAPVLQAMPSGWRNTRLPAQEVGLRWGEAETVVRYRAQRDGSFVVGDDRRAVVHGWTPETIDVEVDGERATARITLDGDRVHVTVGTSTASLELVPRFTVPGPAEVVGGFVAPMPGSVLDVRVAPGQAVAAGQTLVVLEAMKMEHHMAAPADGVVAEVRVAAGDQVANGALLLVFEPADAADAADTPVEPGP